MAQECYRHLAERYGHYAFIQRELDAHPNLLTHDDAARHIQQQHLAEYQERTSLNPGRSSVNRDLGMKTAGHQQQAAREEPKTFEELMASGADQDSPLSRACRRLIDAQKK